MADYTQTKASVVSPSVESTDEEIIFERLSNGVIDVGDVIAMDTAIATRIVRADANDVDLHKALGIALNSADGAGQPVDYIKLDSLFVPGFTGAVGDIVVLSSNPGKMAPSSDLVTGMYAVVMGVMVTTTEMNLKPIIGGLVA